MEISIPDNHYVVFCKSGDPFDLARDKSVIDMADSHPDESFWRPEMGVKRCYDTYYSVTHDRIVLVRKIFGPYSYNTFVESKIVGNIGYSDFQKLNLELKDDLVSGGANTSGQRAEREIYLFFFKKLFGEHVLASSKIFETAESAASFASDISASRSPVIIKADEIKRIVNQSRTEKKEEES
jgi:hypothetical protein